MFHSSGLMAAADLVSLKGSRRSHVKKGRSLLGPQLGAENHVVLHLNCPTFLSEFNPNINDWTNCNEISVHKLM
jgi:hypothetical protein